MGRILPFSWQTDYTLAAVQGAPDLDSYLQTILDDRLAQAPAGSEDAAEAARIETAFEQALVTDLKKALESRGYYDASVEFADRPEQAFSGSFTIDPGSRYTIATLDIQPEIYRAALEDIALQPGDTLDAHVILGQQVLLYDRIVQDRCFLSLDVRNEVVLDKNAHTAALVFHVSAGSEGLFGPLTFSGHTTVKESYLRRLVSWREGACFQQERIETLKSRLLESGLFVQAEAIVPETPDAQGRVPVEMRLTERAHRSISAGLNYYTDQGLGALFGWEHRNILGAGEKLQATLDLSTINQSVDLSLLKPFFMRKDQALSLNTALRRQDTDAFEELSASVGASLERRFNASLSGSLGTELSVNRITEDTQSEEDSRTFGLVSVPAALYYDDRDDTLDPHSGWLLSGSIKPFFDVLGESDPFLKTELKGSTYYALAETPDIVLSLRGGLGSILGGGTFSIPPTERFYAGGGGSVRGFGYQEVGPKDATGDPVGGRSLASGSTELRVRLNEDWGAAAFIDAGSVSEAAVPDLDNLAIGAGLGARYYTDFGPLRFDVAVPLNEKQDLDQNFQIYISIGQAF